MKTGKADIAQYPNYNTDNLNRVYAWDVVDIFCALIVASLPTLNGVIDAGISSLKTWASVSRTSTWQIRYLRCLIPASSGLRY